MISKKDLYVDKLIKELDSKIGDLQPLYDILSDESTHIISDSEDVDLTIIKAKLDMFKNVKGLVEKLSVDIDGVDNEVMLNKDEKKLYLKLIKAGLFFRRLFRLNK